MTDQSRRKFLKRSAMLTTAAAVNSTSIAQTTSSADFYRIATEETFGIPEVYDATARLILSNPQDEVGLFLPPKQSEIVQKLFDLGDGRIAEMDSGRIDKQLLSLWSPGVQIFPAEQGSELAQLVNETLSVAVRRNGERLAGLITIAPQDPTAAALEIERGMTVLGLHGVLINSYTKGEFLDQKKFWPIFEAAVAHNAAIYIHPRKPAPQMYQPFADYSMDGAIWGFHADISTHAVRLILSGVFDQFPELTIVLGHMGEGLPFWINRLDTISSRSAPTIKRKPSEYFLDNFLITTSAMFWDPVLMLSHEVLGPERIMFGVDYPFAPNEAGTEWLDAAPISDADRRMIYSENARRIFYLG